MDANKKRIRVYSRPFAVSTSEKVVAGTRPTYSNCLRCCASACLALGTIFDERARLTFTFTFAFASEEPRLFGRAAMHALRLVPAHVPDLRRHQTRAQQS